MSGHFDFEAFESGSGSLPASSTVQDSVVTIVDDSGDDDASNISDDEVEARIHEVGGVAHDVRHGRVFRGEAVDGDHVTSSAAEGVRDNAGGVTH